MGSELLLAIKSFISMSWAFFTDITVPGTTFSVAQLFIGIFLISFSIKIIGWVLGHYGGTSSDIGNVADSVKERRRIGF